MSHVVTISGAGRYVAKPDARQVNVASVWKKVAKSYVKIAGTWRVYYENIAPAVPGGSISDIWSHLSTPPYPFAKITFAGCVFGTTLADTISGGTVAGARWAVGPDGGSVRPSTLDTIPYEIRATLLSGTLYTVDDGLGGSDSTVVSDAINTWLPLAGAAVYKWKVRRTTVGTNTASVQLDIRLNGTILATGTYNLSAQLT